LRFLELKIPPPLVALLVGAGMWALAQYTPRLELPITYRVVVGVVFAAVGIAIIVAGFVAFFRADTTIDPTRPQRTTALVTIGVYAFSRNPMYLGLLLLLVGWAVYLPGSPDWSPHPLPLPRPVPDRAGRTHPGKTLRHGPHRLLRQSPPLALNPET
jgi:protein-S-isoprenylcysteine O-methyltransferase Ste14